MFSPFSSQLRNEVNKFLFLINVYLLIASVKMIVIRNRTTMSLFSSIGIPPVFIVTKWSS